MPLARAELRGRVFKSDATMCNRCRKLLLFNDFLVAPTTIVACISCARNERSGNDYFISACLHPFFFLFFFLVAYLLLESGYSCQLYELYYYDRYSRERERLCCSSLEIEISKNRLINRCCRRSTKQLFA